jgi:sialate O-acetylesterase
MQPYNEPSAGVKLNPSDLYNAMIYPFTRMVVYGSIWYQGESNAGNPTYACKFAKMIEYWRQTWNTRTNGITDTQFPFGFVQVGFIRAHSDLHSSID